MHGLRLELTLIIKTVELAAFRGIPSRLTLNFTDDKFGKAQPAILFGENGSGKSSIVDALEFGLRGRLSRRGLGGEKHKREVRNLMSRRAPGVLLTMSDGSQILRGGGIKVDGLVDHQAEVIEGYEYCPIVVRRHDVESFWTIPASQRQEFFFDYMRDLGGLPAATEQRASEERLERASAKLERAQLRFQRSVGQVPIPTSYAAARKMLGRDLLPKFGEGAPGRKKLPQRVYGPFVELRDALENIEKVRTAESDRPTNPLASDRLREVLATVSGRVSEDFATVARKDWITSIAVLLGSDASLEINVLLSNGEMADPVQVLNEAALDLLALLILVEVHVQCGIIGQRKLLVLDDVFQSVDAVHRIRALEHVLRRLRGWQVILTLHDRLWLELARSAMQRAGHNAVITLEVVSTTVDEPPLIRRTGNGPVKELEELIATSASPSLIAGASGRTLEQLCDTLSVNLAIKLTRRKGDKYTLGDLWPGVQSALKKAGDAELSSAAQSVDMFVALRNLAGAHYNEWAATLTRNEATDFAQSVAKLWRNTTCADCGSTVALFRPVSGSQTLIRWSCKCEEVAAPRVAADASLIDAGVHASGQPPQNPEGSAIPL